MLRIRLSLTLRTAICALCLSLIPAGCAEETSSGDPTVSNSDSAPSDGTNDDPSTDADTDTGDDAGNDTETSEPFDVILDYKVSDLMAPMRWPISGGIHAEYVRFYELPEGVLDEPDARLFLLLDWFNNDIDVDLVYTFYLYQLPGDDIWLPVRQAVWPTAPFVEGSVRDESDPDNPITMQTAPLGGVGLLPTDKLVGVNVWDITDVAVGATGNTPRDYLGGAAEGEINFMYGGYDSCIRQSRIYVGHYGR